MCRLRATIISITPEPDPQPDPKPDPQPDPKPDPEPDQGMDSVQGDEVQSAKVLIEGELYIIRGGKMYDAQGKMIKK